MKMLEATKREMEEASSDTSKFDIFTPSVRPRQSEVTLTSSYGDYDEARVIRMFAVSSF